MVRSVWPVSGNAASGSFDQHHAGKNSAAVYAGPLEAADRRKINDTKGEGQ